MDHSVSSPEKRLIEDTLGETPFKQFLQGVPSQLGTPFKIDQTSILGQEFETLRIEHSKVTTQLTNYQHFVRDLCLSLQINPDEPSLPILSNQILSIIKTTQDKSTALEAETEGLRKKVQDLETQLKKAQETMTIETAKYLQYMNQDGFFLGRDRLRKLMEGMKADKLDKFHVEKISMDYNTKKIIVEYSFSQDTYQEGVVEDQFYREMRDKFANLESFCEEFIKLKTCIIRNTVDLYRFLDPTSPELKRLQNIYNLLKSTATRVDLSRGSALTEDSSRRDIEKKFFEIIDIAEDLDSTSKRDFPDLNFLYTAASIRVQKLIEKLQTSIVEEFLGENL